MAIITSIKNLFSLALIYKLYIHYLNVKIALLNEYLNKQVYMEKLKVLIL